MNVLLIGFGKIGQIKAALWQSMGLTVLVYDISPTAQELIVESGYQIATPLALKELRLSKELIVDVSTPASTHASALTWALDTLAPNYPMHILLEKPVVSSAEELRTLELTLARHADFDKNNLIVNESYFSSAALRKVKAMIDESGEELKLVSVELSKNRISDNDNGRFFDYSLGALGIEMPHMVAILQYFGLSLDELAGQNPKLYVDRDRFDNQGFTMHYKENGTSIELKSFLGNFRLSTNTARQKNEGIIRVLELATKSRHYKIIFDPAPGVPRYHAKIVVADKIANVISETVISDNHLEQHLRQLSSSKKSDTWNLSSLDNGLKITDILLKLQKSAFVTELDLQEFEAKVLV